MKTSITSCIAAAIFLFFARCTPGQPDSQTFTVSNNLDIPRINEVITIPAKKIRPLIPPHHMGGLTVREAGQQTLLRSQFIDYELDGEIDEVLFLASIGPNETKTFIVEQAETPADAENTGDTLQTYSRFVPERQNDYAWENDRVAFRAYGLTDTTAEGRRTRGGGIDAFFKRVSYPIINKWYRNNAENEGAYHIDTGEGYDPYQVGASRGLGGTGVWDEDSLYVSSHFIRSKTIAEGPLRTLFELTYAPWDANGRTVTETKRISLDLGSHLFKVTELISSDKPLPNMVAGITLHEKKGDVNANAEEGWFRYWEPIDDSWLGTAIVMDPAHVSDYADHRVAAPDQSHLLVFTNPVDNRVVFYAGYAWEKSGHFTTEAAWETYLSDFSKRLASPLTPVFQ